VKEITDDLYHDLTFYCTHNQLCAPMFRVLGIYNFWLFLFCTVDEEAIPTQSSGKNGKQIRAELSKSF